MQDQNNELIKALNFHKNGDFKNAEMGYKIVLKCCPDDDIALNYYSLLCNQAGHLNEAINLLSK